MPLSAISRICADAQVLHRIVERRLLYVLAGEHEMLRIKNNSRIRPLDLFIYRCYTGIY